MRLFFAFQITEYRNQTKNIPPWLFDEIIYWKIRDKLTKMSKNKINSKCCPYIGYCENEIVNRIDIFLFEMYTEYTYIVRQSKISIKISIDSGIPFLLENMHRCILSLCITSMQFPIAYCILCYIEIVVDLFTWWIFVPIYLYLHTTKYSI